MNNLKTKLYFLLITLAISPLAHAGKAQEAKLKALEAKMAQARASLASATGEYNRLVDKLNLLNQARVHPEVPSSQRVMQLAQKLQKDAPTTLALLAGTLIEMQWREVNFARVSLDLAECSNLDQELGVLLLSTDPYADGLVGEASLNRFSEPEFSKNFGIENAPLLKVFFEMLELNIIHPTRVNAMNAEEIAAKAASIQFALKKYLLIAEKFSDPEIVAIVSKQKFIVESFWQSPVEGPPTERTISLENIIRYEQSFYQLQRGTAFNVQRAIESVQYALELQRQVVADATSEEKAASIDVQKHTPSTSPPLEREPMGRAFR